MRVTGSLVLAASTWSAISRGLPRVAASVRLSATLLFVGWCAIAVGQPLTVGTLGNPTGTFGPGLTVLDFSSPSNRAGNLTSATFFWSTAPCTASVKIKVVDQEFRVFHGYSLLFAGERGPFDVSGTIQTVALVPPLSVRAGSHIAIAGVTSCGGPVWTGEPRASQGSLVFPGDWTASAASSAPFSPSTPLSVLVQGSDDAVVLLKNRFVVRLTATDLRTGRSTVGRGISQGDRFGYFSLPEFTGDPDFPEVIVKMADATQSPPPFGGSFWFFHSSLTDVQYTLTVTDQVSGRVRTYSNLSGALGQLCGAADTSAFGP